MPYFQKIIFAAGFLALPAVLYAQEDTAVLEQVAVKAYLHDSLSRTPAAINTITPAALQRYNSGSVLPALNATPGVRMEERSPGSYRLSIRGSALRSPFGVRNVKVYYGDIPVSDPGGFTYFNMFGYGSFSGISVIKGPGSSLYGAGNGGVVLLQPPAPEGGFAEAGVSAGAFGTRMANAAAGLAGKTFSNAVYFEYASGNGYRSQSAFERKTAGYHALWNAGRRTTVRIHALYTGLYYETPGGLTEREYNEDPRQARPAAGKVPGAATQHAAVYQQNLLAGITVAYRFSDRLENTTTGYGLISSLENPNIRNYSRTRDPHGGGRTVFSWHQRAGAGVLHLAAGAEVQLAQSSVVTYNNDGGAAGKLQSENRISSSNLLAFAQASYRTGRWVFESGLGVSRYQVHIVRLAPEGPSDGTLLQPLTPRFAVLYRAAGAASVYLNVSKGYSPPTVDELAPSGSAVNTGLRPEYGWNYEAGLRGAIGKTGFRYDLSAFAFDLSHAIVVRKDSAGGDFYVNAGSTRQRGIELRLDQRLLFPDFFMSRADLWASVALYDFRYGNFGEGTKDYSGNRMPGVAAATISAGADLRFAPALLVSVHCYRSGSMWLDDANSASARPYTLLGVKAGYDLRFGKLRTELFAGADNLLNERYSLGYDINAANGRYYNAAMPLNVYAGLKLRLGFAGQHAQ